MKKTIRINFQLFLIIVLAILPVIAITLGWKFLEERSAERAKNNQRDQAHQLLEPLTQKWQFKQQMARVCGAFHRELSKKLLIDLHKPVSLPDLQTSILRTFKKPFPDNDLWVFKYSTEGLSQVPKVLFSQKVAGNSEGAQRPPPILGASQNWRAAGDEPCGFTPRGEGGRVPPFNEKVPKVVHSPPKNPLGKHSLALAFHFLASKRLNREIPERDEIRGKKLIQQLLGKDIPIQVLIDSQMGVPTKVLHRNKFYWLFWSLVQNDQTPLGGFIILLPQGDSTNKAGMLLALNAHMRSMKGLFQGFVRFHPSPLGDIIHPKLEKSGLFCGWWQDWRSKNDFRQIEVASEPQSPPWEVELGQKTMFAEIIPNCTHLAVILLPRVDKRPMPSVLFFFNLISVMLWVLVVSRGFLLNQWPRVSLKWRFAGLYLLASGLPFCLVTIAAVAYLQEREESLLRQSKQKILSDLKGIDQSKDQMQNLYLTVLRSILQNQELEEHLRREGLSYPSLLSDSLSFFSNASPPLPLNSLSFFDLNGGVASWAAPNINKTSVEGFSKFFRAILVSCMFERIKDLKGPNLPKDLPLDDKDKILIEGYEKATDVKTTTLGEERCSVPEIIEAGGIKTTKIHDFISIDGIARFAILISWRANDLDNETLKQASKEFQKNHSDSTFCVYQFADEFLEQIIFSPSKQSQLPKENDHKKISILTAQSASRGASSICMVLPENGLLVVGAQSRSFPGKIIVAIENIQFIFDELEVKKWWLFGLLILSTISIGFLGVVTSYRIITPIAQVKRGLDAVAVGNYEMRVGILRRDELGRLTQAFDHMIQELDRKKRLTTIVSETALDAMAQYQDSDSHGESLASKLTRGTRASVIFLVSDIRSFTTMCESRPVKEITSLLNNHFDQMSEVISLRGGRINKFIGDAINVVFYLDSQNQRVVAQKAIETGLEMLKRLKEINQIREKEKLSPYSIGVGLSTGEVIMGGVGDPHSMHFDHAIMGFPVKDAGWLESLSKLVPYCPLVMSPKVAEFVPELNEKLIPLADYPDQAVVFRPSATEN